MRPDVYICSKPLQFFNIKNIGDIDGESSRKILIILKNFSNADVFIENIRHNDKTWEQVIELSQKSEYYDYISNNKINYLFVENDASYKMAAFMLKSKLINRVEKLFVFEEGIGSYRNDLHFGLDKFVRELFFVGSHYGASVYCDGIILYEPDLYNRKFSSKKALPFSTKFIDGLKKNKELFLAICDAVPEELNFTNKKVLIYITNHDIDTGIINRMINEHEVFDYAFVKPHPHITDFSNLPKGIKVIKTNILVEFILFLLLTNNNKITVYHQASTSLVYFYYLVEETSFAKFPIYDEFIDYIKTTKSIIISNE